MCEEAVTSQPQSREIAISVKTEREARHHALPIWCDR